MIPFLIAQAGDPFDPALMLIQADWLEGGGDATAAAVLRGLAGAGIPSLHALALDATMVGLPYAPDHFRTAEGDNYGAGAGDGAWYGYGHGERDGSQYGGENGSGEGAGELFGYGGGYGGGFGSEEGEGEGFGDGASDEFTA